MIDGFLKDFKSKHLYIINYNHKPILDITEFVDNLTVTPLFNGTDEMSFSINYDDKYKHIYNEIGKETFYMLEDYGCLMTSSFSENDNGLLATKNITCKSEEYRQFSQRNITLVNTSTNYVSLPLYSTDDSDCLLNKLIGTNGEVPLWTVGTVDGAITTKPYTFKDVKKNNMLNFIYKNMEETYDCIPFFDSINHKISFKKYDNSIEDTGIILAMDTLISEFGKNCITDTYCTKMYVEGGNLDIRRVNPHGLNFVYDYGNVYSKMSPTLRNHLKEWLETCDSYEDEYKSKFAEWSEAQTQYDLNKAKYESLDDTDTQFWAENGFKTETEPDESDWFLEWMQRYNEWGYSSGYFEARENMKTYSTISKSKKTELDEINNICKRSNFLTQEDLVELDMFEIEKSYKQDAFAYVKGMSEKEKGDISLLLKQYAQEEIARCNKPRFDFTVKLANFCTIKGCENFANQLNVGKYIRVMDSKGNMYKIIVVKIEANRDDDKDITVTFSDKMTGHERFPLLNEYINNYMKTIEEQEKINNRLDEFEDRFTSITANIDSTNIRVDMLYDNLGKIGKDESYGKTNWQRLDRYTNGFIINATVGEDGSISGGHHFERQANGDLLYKNDNRVIVITSNDSVLPIYKTTTSTE